jgi:PAS domain S-box-containing protein
MHLKNDEHGVSNRTPETLEREELVGLVYAMQEEQKKLASQIQRLQKALDKAETIALTAGDVTLTGEQKKKKKYIKLLLENTPNIILIFNKEGQLVLCTTVFLKLANIESFNCINGHTFQEVYALLEDQEPISKAIAEQFEHIRAHNRSMETHTKIRFPDRNEYRDYIIQINPLFDPAGTFEGLMISYQDATDLLQAEANERTRIMLDATPVACSFWDQDGVIIDCNKAVLNIFGLTEKRDFIEHFFDLSPEFQPDGEASTEKQSRLHAAALETGYQKFEWMYRTAAGEPLSVETTLVRVPWKNGYCITAYSRDLREIKAKEVLAKEADERRRELEIQTLAAQAASESKSRFLASMSHEIRTPIYTIIGMIDLISTDNLNPTQRNYFGDIKKMSQVLLQIVNDILDLSQIEAGKLELRPIHFNLRELYDHICSMSRFTAEAKQLAFRHVWEAKLPTVIYGDHIRIYQMLINIINNAVKYTKKGYVDFKVNRVIRNNREHIAFTVKDTGLGIKREQFSRLFDYFERLDREINRDVLGSGLGLSITKSLADLMGAEIEVESEYGTGSRFRILLPLIEGDPRQVAQIGDASRITVTGDVKVLVVDDNPLNLKVTLAFLSACGIKADAVQSGAEAIQRAQEQNYDLFFMDHIMAEMDGMETTRRIRALEGERYIQTPIIALTADGSPDDREALLHAAMNDVLAKPISAGKLNKMLLRWLPPAKVSILPDLPKRKAPEPIQKAGLPLGGAVPAAEGSDREQIRSLAERLKPLLEAGNTESFNLLEEIRTSFRGEPGEVLIKQMEDFEFDRALQTLLRITKG